MPFLCYVTYRSPIGLCLPACTFIGQTIDWVAVTTPKKPGPLVDEDEATLQLIEMALLFRRGKSKMLPVTIAATKRFKTLLGIKSLATGEKSDRFPKGKSYWQFPDDMAVNLERIGIDPATHVCIDRGKFNLALLELEQAEAAKLEAKYAGQDLEARSAAIHEAMQRYRPTKPPKTATPSQVLESYHLNNKIAREIIKAQEGFSPSPYQKKIAAAPDDYVPGQYGMPIGGDDPPPPPKTAPSAEEIKRRYREQQGGLTF
jgi:hypothetical protein